MFSLLNLWKCSLLLRLCCLICDNLDPIKLHQDISFSNRPTTSGAFFFFFFLNFSRKPVDYYIALPQLHHSFPHPRVPHVVWLLRVYIYTEVIDGLVVRAGVSVTCNVLSWSGGHEFEPWLGWTWGAWYFCRSHTWTKNIYFICYLTVINN